MSEENKGETSLKSLRLRKLLDQSTFAYWALLCLTGPYRALAGLYWALLGPYWALLGLTGLPLEFVHTLTD